jgi:hypothetical protein
MAVVEPARERVARMLHDAVTRLHEDIERVEFWTEVLGCLTRPVPDYTAENSKLNQFNLPGREGRAGHSDFTKGDEKASLTQLGNGSKRAPSRR